MSESVASNTPVANTSESQNIGSEVKQGSEETKHGNNQPTLPQKKKFKYKADGADVEEELDDSEIANRLSLAKAANKRMQEAATTKKQIENFLQQLQNDPISVLSNDKLMGTKKFREIAEDFLIKQLEEEALTPEQRLQKQRDVELDNYKRQEQERIKAEDAKKTEAMEENYRQQYEKTIIEALQTSNLPKNEFTVRRMAELLQKNIDLGLDLQPSQLAQLVREDYILEQKSLVGGLSAEQFISMFGDDMANKLRKHDLAKLQIKNPVPKKSQENQAVRQPQRISPREFSEQLRNRFK